MKTPQALWKRNGLFLLAFSAAVITQPVQASADNWQAVKSHLGYAFAGAAASVVAHELGHLATAAAHDVDAEFDGVTIVYPDQDMSDREQLRIASAGYQVQWGLSEYAFSQLQQPDLSGQKRAWNSGLVLGYIGTAVAYATLLKDHEDGDSQGIANASGLSTGEVAAILALPAVLDGWRLFGDHTPRWVPWVSRGTKAVGIGAVWSF